MGGGGGEGVDGWKVVFAPAGDVVLFEDEFFGVLVWLS